jgi:hypothetical protein
MTGSGTGLDPSRQIAVRVQKLAQDQAKRDRATRRSTCIAKAHT